MHFIPHATRRTPYGASHPMSAWSVKARRASSRHCRGARVYGVETTAIPEMSTPPPPPVLNPHTTHHAAPSPHQDLHHPSNTTMIPTLHPHHGHHDHGHHHHTATTATIAYTTIKNTTITPTPLPLPPITTATNTGYTIHATNTRPSMRPPPCRRRQG